MLCACDQRFDVTENLKKILQSGHWYDGKKLNIPVQPGGRVHQTGGNRSGPVLVSAGTQSAKIQTLNLNSKNPKKFLKILQGAMNLMVSNFLKKSFI